MLEEVIPFQASDFSLVNEIMLSGDPFGAFFVISVNGPCVCEHFLVTPDTLANDQVHKADREGTESPKIRHTSTKNEVRGNFYNGTVNNSKSC